MFTRERGTPQEHGVEVHLPFLQFILQDFNIVPIVMGDQSKIYIDELAERLSDNIDDSTL